MEWKYYFNENLLRGAQEYINNNAVHEVHSSDGIISGIVSGVDDFHVSIQVKDDAIEEMHCTCPLAQTGLICKHMPAVLFAWEKNALASAKPKEEIEIQPPTRLNDYESSGSNGDAPGSDEVVLQNHDGSVQLQADVNTFFTYALQQNHVAIVRSITIKNLSEEEMDNLSIRIWTDADLIDPYSQKIDLIPPKEEQTFKNFKIRVHGDFLASLTERITCNLYVAVIRENEEIARQSEEIAVLAYDQWPGYPRYYPDLLAAYITPNHPAIAGLMQSAVKYLEKWTGKPAFDAYQSGDPNRVLMMAAAAYAAIQEKNIFYAESPASFEDMGQRIRLADDILENRFANCMDITLLYAGCLEAMSLNPILVMMSGHICAGVWLVDDSFPDPWTDDPTQVEKRLADGINEIAVVECTAMCAGRTTSFDDARALGEQNVSTYDQFEFSIDLTRARKSGVRPLPVRIKGTNGFVIQHEERDEEDVTAAPAEKINILDTFGLGNEKRVVTKQVQWERKLLDLSMRNMLINMRVGSSVIPVLSADLASLEDSLSEGVEFEVLQRPAEWEMHGIEAANIESVNNLGPYRELIDLETKHHRLHSWLQEKDLTKLLTKMYRSAKSSMEENGASTLYMTLGLLRWYEGIRTKKVHYAPIVLLPIDIIRKPASKGYVIRERDDEAQINITLLEFLKQNFQMEIPGLNPPPKDDHGLDIEMIFAIIRHAVMGQEMWDVLESAFIGNFSFSQFVMWNDIRNHSDLLERNKIVHALMNGAIDWDCTIPDAVNSEEAYLPVPVDASQLRAINMAANDVSFVLHGPPGTGKSQTITAMIANALTKGKTVLFVAEKMAALEVVQKRLAALGIGDFCLELHSNKTVKKNVLDQLKRGLDIDVGGIRTDYENKIDDVRKTRVELDAYVKKLHETHACGMSVRELIDAYESISDQPKSFKPNRDYVLTLTQENLVENQQLLTRLVDAGRQVGHPKGHVFAFVKQAEYTQSLRIQLEEVLDTYGKSLRLLQKAAEQFATQVNESTPISQKQWLDLYGLADCIIKSERIPAFLTNGVSVADILSPVRKYLSVRDRYVFGRAQFLQRYDVSVLNVDFNVYRTRYADAGRKLFGKAKAIEAVSEDLRKYVKIPVGQELLSAIEAEVEGFRRLEAECRAAQQAIPEYLYGYISSETTTRSLDELQAMWERQLAEISMYSGKVRSLKLQGQFSQCIEGSKVFLDAYEKVRTVEDKLCFLVKMKISHSEEDWIAGKQELISLFDNHSLELRDWITYQGAKAACEQSGMQDICQLYEDGLDHDAVIPVYFKSIYRALIWSIVEQEPVLNKFTGNSFNERIKEYNRMEQELLELTKKEMHYILTHNLPTGFESIQINRELAILRKAISSGGRGMSIRNLFDQIPHVLVKLCPCFLMSPISVAQYLSADNDLFDIVIFDEASQLPTCKAVGVLARGKNAVIVGDPNQMPPTSFFAGNMIDEDNLDIEDLDSILDDCLALGMPEAHLKWHYRSRHESLIAFSNMEYYDNSMLTFPSVNDREKHVRLCTVNGTFNRKKGRINEEEGKAVVREVLRRYHDEELSKQTIGIVTFNINQQGFIEDLLNEEYKKSLKFDQWANEREERLFVKNLENVQGDERDVILFSVGFGPDEDGKVSLNFGPLNKEGGWKRLNVAVSRARMEMIVFSSLTPEMIDLNRTKAKGVEGLRAFLEFAGKGRLGGISHEASSRAAGIAKQICSVIEDAGYKVQRDIGHSDFKVDIAVVNPYDEDEYLLGVMLDGNSYRRSSNTKDRELSQVSVLRSLGWKLLRIWTMDWWDNRNKELTNLLRCLEEQKEIARVAAEEAKPKDDGPQSEEIDYTKPEEHKTTTRTTKETPREIDDFNSREKYTPLIPHKQSRDDLSRYANEEEDEEEEQISGESQIAYYLRVEFQNAAVSTGTSLNSYDLVTREGKEIALKAIEEIERIEAPISMDRLIVKTLRAVQIGRTSPGLIEAVEALVKKTDVKRYKQNGKYFIWLPDQQPENYPYYRVDADCSDKRSMDDISQQELKNAICLALTSRKALDKSSLIKETVSVMGFNRSGAKLVDAIERGLKYGRKTGEIVLNEDGLFTLRQRA